MSELLLFVDLPRRGAENMRLDSMLLERCARAEITGAIRIYSFAPACLSLGRLQDERDVDRGACERDGVDVVRRPSGGRAVLHDHEVTYAVVCRASDTDFGGRVLEACARIHSAIATGLARIGANTRVRSLGDDERTAAKARAALADCFAKPSAHELVDPHGRKLVGSAQARRAGALLQHGSILLEPHRAGSYLRSGTATASSTSLHELLGRPVGKDEVADALVDGFRSVAGNRLVRIDAPHHSMVC